MFPATNQSRLSLLLCFLAVSLVPPAARSDEPAGSNADSNRAELRNRFQAGLDEIRQKYDLPGMTAAFALPDGDVVAFATGMADQERSRKMTVDTRMLAGSVGKTFVAATALALDHDGKLLLDDKIEKYLGKEPWFEKLPGAHEITVRQLAMHQSGVADHVYDPRFVARARRLFAAPDSDPNQYFKPKELVEFILDRDSLFQPGKGYAYTDTGYILLGLIIERAAGKSYYDQVQTRFLKPLKLTRTSPADRLELANLAAGYVAKDNPFGLPQKVTTDDGAMRYNPRTEWTGGGLVSNPQDLVRWAKALYEGKALKRPYLEELIAGGDKSKKRWYGLGVSVAQTEMGMSYGHSGWTPGYLTLLSYFPAERVALAVQVNSDLRNDMLGAVMSLFNDVLQAVGSAQ